MIVYNKRLPKEYAILRIRYKKLKAEYDELKEQLKQNYIKNESSLKIKTENIHRKDNTKTMKTFFKGKRLDNGEWVEGNSLGPSFDSNYYIVTYVIGNHQVCGECACPFDCDDLYEVDPATVGQFTGLCDKNERKIFEGDILRDGLGVDGIVTYFESIASFKYRVGNEVWNLNEGDPNRPTQLQYTEVIGNIHDNLEFACFPL